MRDVEVLLGDLGLTPLDPAELAADQRVLLRVGRRLVTIPRPCAPRTLVGATGWAGVAGATVAPHGGTQSGDLLWAQGFNSITTPSGWTYVGTNSYYRKWWYRVADGTSSDNFVVTAGAGNAYVVVAAIRGAAPTDSISVYTSLSDTGNYVDADSRSLAYSTTGTVSVPACGLGVLFVYAPAVYSGGFYAATVTAPTEFGSASLMYESEYKRMVACWGVQGAATLPDDGTVQWDYAVTVPSALTGMTDLVTFAAP